MDIQAVILAGGKGKRLGIDIPKCMLDINGKKLIDICIENLMSSNINEYVLLLGYKHELVESHLSRYNNINIRYSIDPDTNVNWGKGKALKYALINQHIDKKKRMLITFPDDIILDSSIYNKFIKAHLNAVDKYGVLASVMLVSGTRYPYGVAKLDRDNIVYKFEEKPLIEMPTNMGIYVFEPEVYDLVESNIDLDYPDVLELENTIMPILAKEHRLYGFLVDANKWLPVNTKKEYEIALKVLAPF